MGYEDIVYDCVKDRVLLQRPLPAPYLSLGRAPERHSPQSEHAQALHQLQKAKLSTEENLRSHTAFLANMAHELRTPLNAVIGYAQMIGMQNGPLSAPEKHGQYAANIEDAADHMLSIVNDLLDISKINAEKLDLTEEEFDICGLFDDAMSMVLNRAVESEIDMKIRIPKIFPNFRGDRRRLLQALLNLLSNAVKFTPPGGTVTLGAHVGESGGIEIFIRDTGFGMKAEDIPKALSEFGQVAHGLHQKNASSGLGLPLSKRLVELHGGILNIESSPGNGTCVRITLPENRTVGMRTD